MAGAAVVALSVHGCGDIRSIRLHGKADIDVAEPTRESRPVNPVVEYDRGKTGAFGMFLDDHSSIFGWRRIVPRN